MTTFIFDLDGTLVRGTEVLPGALEAIDYLRLNGHRVVYATNDATGSRQHHRARLEQLGFEVEHHGLMTSAYSTGLYLGNLDQKPQSIYVLGSEALREEIALQCPDARFDDVSGIDTVVVSFEPAFSYEHLSVAQAAVLGGARLIATNRDPQFPGQDRIYPGAGALVAAVETACQVDATVIGKPSPYMYYALMELTGSTPENTVVIGDSLVTDIAAAAPLGIFSVLVLTGVHKLLPVNAPVTPDRVIPSVAHLIGDLQACRPDLVMPIDRRADISIG